MPQKTPDLAQLWQETHVANLMAVTSPEGEHGEIGAFTITDGIPLIFSLDPAHDFEVTSHNIASWKLFFMTSDNEMLGMTGYFKALGRMKPYILDEENGSVLMRALSRDELQELFQKSS